MFILLFLFNTYFTSVFPTEMYTMYCTSRLFNLNIQLLTSKLVHDCNVFKWYLCWYDRVLCMNVIS